jgi:hypothetical protein
MARTSYSLEEYIVSESVYFVSLVLLFYNFIALIYESLHGLGLIPIIAAVAVCSMLSGERSLTSGY